MKGIEQDLHFAVFANRYYANSELGNSEVLNQLKFVKQKVLILHCSFFRLYANSELGNAEFKISLSFSF